MEKKLTLSLAHLYPELMNLYGDMGNIIAFQKRCEWHGISLLIENINTSEDLKCPHDIYFIGGGQDRQQVDVAYDIQKIKNLLIQERDNNAVFLSICGGYQLFGHYYKAQDGRNRCFYVDFIIRLKNGTILLLDTKTHGSDENGAEKNNALYEFVNTYRQQGVKMYGGVLIQEQENWYFPDGPVDNIDSTAGWTRLELNKL